MPALSRLSRPLQAGLLALLLCLPALVNGFPLVFNDTAHYLRKPFAFAQELARGRLSTDAGQYRGYMPSHFGGGEDGAAAPAAAPGAGQAAPVALSGNPFFLRPAPYSLALLPFATALTVLLVPFAQALLAVLLAGALLRALLGPAPPGWARLAMAAALLASSAPWLASLVMPDVLTGCLALWLALLVLGGDWLRQPWRAAGFALLGAFLIGSHLSHLPLAAAGAVAGVGARWWLDGRRDALRWWRAGIAGLALLAAAGGLLGTNLAFGKKATLSESSPLFLLARMVGDGTAGTVLEDACPQGADWLLCRDPGFWRLDSDLFLWRPDSPWLRHWDQRDRFLAEAREITGRVLREHPGAQARQSLANAARQLVTLWIDPALVEPPQPSFVELLRQMGDPAARLSADSLASRADPGFAAWRRAQDVVQQALFWLALAGLGVAAALARGARRGPILAAAALAVALVLGNAVLSGALSAVHGRYQSRITWPVTLLAVASLAALARPRETMDRAAAPRYEPGRAGLAQR
ncbi:hypothetical protein [Paracraurococcus ruber]|uniref:Uncharacterized protein n=1 Tax=Paracraurococcus ruber TaxID=77675 RepID=A0ABS1D227_9PROT|nr:hypothetical protein [Paracraurococcus ruber]MBK1660867.1 hypothetical protein [Paracraurococcus ruber]TDG29893.1 hypothetical protein E2C05_16375 [Paracraurococcus ruber]